MRIRISIDRIFLTGLACLICFTGCTNQKQEYSNSRSNDQFQGESKSQVSWQMVKTIRCRQGEEEKITFVADSTWRLRWREGGRVNVETKPINAENDQYTFGILDETEPISDPNQNPGTHRLILSLCEGDCEIVVEEAK